MPALSRLRRSTFRLAVLLAAAVASHVYAAEPHPDTAIVGVTVVPGDGRAPMRDRTVLIRDGQIFRIERTRAFTPKRGIRVLDGAGRYLIPGLIDTHAHVALGPVAMDRDRKPPALVMQTDPQVTAVSLRRLLAYGVTTARDPGGPAEATVAARRAVEAGTLLLPRLQVAGEVIDTAAFAGLAAAVEGPDGVAAEVARQADLGVDWIKLYAGLTPQMTRAGIEAAHRHGLKVTGHLVATSWTEAAEMGIDSLVHITPGSPDLLPPAARPAYARSLSSSIAMLRWQDLADPASPEHLGMIAALKRRGVSIDPTLVVFHAMANGDRAEYTQNPALVLAAPSLVANWREVFTLSAGWKPEDFEEARRIWPKVERFTKLLFDQGIPLTAGSDANNPWVVPGDSLHKELELLVRAGIAPLDVLTIATRNGAQVLGLAQETGVIAPGKRADLVLLRADPTTDIRATRQIEWVMKDGRVYLPADLLD